MSNQLQRQRQRNEVEVERVLDGMRVRRGERVRQLADKHGSEYAAKVLIAAEGARTRLRAPRPPATREQLAILSRQLEVIVSAKSKDAHGKEQTIVQTERAISLVDQLQRDSMIPFELHRAGEFFAELFWTAQGRSHGVSTYGDYMQSSPASQRSLTTDRQMKAYDRFKAAAFAVFGTPRQDGRLAFDEQLFALVMPALLSDKKSVTQSSIGAARSAYTGRAQKPAAGGQVVVEILHKLCLHFQYKER